MMSKIPIDLKNMEGKDIEKEVLRVAIIAELDAINLYEQMAAMVKDEGIKAVLKDVADEEKTHVGEFLTLLLKLDEKQVEEMEKGSKEVEEILGGE
ncbi:MAG TPA: rubrerythrin [Thermoplasmatales archaeon]|nr:rubrerythrin [Thermoplasmatales archaeon]